MNREIINKMENLSNDFNVKTFDLAMKLFSTRIITGEDLIDFILLEDIKGSDIPLQIIKPLFYSNKEYFREKIFMNDKIVTNVNKYLFSSILYFNCDFLLDPYNEFEIINYPSEDINYSSYITKFLYDNRKVDSEILEKFLFNNIDFVLKCKDINNLIPPDASSIYSNSDITDSEYNKMVDIIIKIVKYKINYLNKKGYDDIDIECLKLFFKNIDGNIEDLNFRFDLYEKKLKNVFEIIKNVVEDKINKKVYINLFL